MSGTPVTLFDRIGAFFARDKDDFWFNHYTSDEKAMSRMDAWQLAKVIHEANVRNTVDFAEKKIVAEYLLSARLARIQAKPNYIALCVAVVVGFGSAYLTATLQKSPEQAKCECEYPRANDIQNIEQKGVVPKTDAVTKQPDRQKSIDVQNNNLAVEKNKP